MRNKCEGKREGSKGAASWPFSFPAYGILIRLSLEFAKHSPVLVDTTASEREMINLIDEVAEARLKHLQRERERERVRDKDRGRETESDWVVRHLYDGHNDAYGGRDKSKDSRHLKDEPDYHYRKGKKDPVKVPSIMDDDLERREKKPLRDEEVEEDCEDRV
ncbi:RNA-binding protein 25-like [Telopea speciosissima]|uniref:RNA-binding protein 25-like n=1 Tax=Telopea speciosissima TaxID=54955 RepID=UPI001CC52283|nr:RNA-binding protein 25-like [Telopea speciosissima]